jgi:hypothetical protein
MPSETRKVASSASGGRRAEDDDDGGDAVRAPIRVPAETPAVPSPSLQFKPTASATGAPKEEEEDDDTMPPRGNRKQHQHQHQAKATATATHRPTAAAVDEPGPEYMLYDDDEQNNNNTKAPTATTTKNPAGKIPRSARAAAVSPDGAMQEKNNTNQRWDNENPNEEKAQAKQKKLPAVPGAIRVAGINTTTTTTNNNNHHNPRREEEERNQKEANDARVHIASGQGDVVAQYPSMNNNDSKAGDAVVHLETGMEEGYGTTFVPIAAELAPDDDDVAKRVADCLQTELAEHLEREVAERMKKERELQVVAEAVEVKPSADEDPDENEVEDDEICGNTRKCCCLLLVIGFLLVATGVAVAVVFATTPSPITMAMAPTDPPTVVPTDAPTNAPTRYTSERFQFLLDLIGPTVTSNIQFLQDPETPQYAALEWMADVDEWNLDINSLPLQLWVERYVLVLFYLSTNGKTWREQYNFLQETSVCEWSELNEGVICDGLYVTELNFGT